MAEELLESLTSMTTHDPEEEYEFLLDSYNTSWNPQNINVFLKSVYNRYKIYKIKINLFNYPELLNKINQFIEYYDTNKMTKKQLFDFSKIIDNQIINLLNG